jgi:hypothetical protein
MRKDGPSSRPRLRRAYRIVSGPCAHPTRSRAFLMRSDRQSALRSPLLSCPSSLCGSAAGNSPARFLILAARIVSAHPSRFSGDPSNMDTAWKRSCSSLLALRSAKRERAAALDCGEPSGKAPGLIGSTCTRRLSRPPASDKCISGSGLGGVPLGGRAIAFLPLVPFSGPLATL